MADIQIGLRAVVGHEDLAVLERVHRAWIDVQVRIQLLHAHPQAAHLQQAAEAGSGEPLAEAGCDASGHEDMPGQNRSLGKR